MRQKSDPEARRACTSHKKPLAQAPYFQAGVRVWF